MATDPSKYDEAVPHIRAHLARVGRAVGRTWTAHAGQPYRQVHPALVEALEEEGVGRMVLSSSTCSPGRSLTAPSRRF